MRLTLATLLLLLLAAADTLLRHNVTQRGCIYMYIACVTLKLRLHQRLFWNFFVEDIYNKKLVRRELYYVVSFFAVCITYIKRVSHITG